MTKAFPSLVSLHSILTSSSHIEPSSKSVSNFEPSPAAGKEREGKGRTMKLTAGLVISFVFLSIGTLKSTRIRTRSPLRETSLMESLEERDMVEVVFWIGGSGREVVVGGREVECSPPALSFRGPWKFRFGCFFISRFEASLNE